MRRKTERSRPFSSFIPWLPHVLEAVASGEALLQAAEANANSQDTNALASCQGMARSSEPRVSGERIVRKNTLVAALDNASCCQVIAESWGCLHPSAGNQKLSNNAKTCRKSCAHTHAHKVLLMWPLGTSYRMELESRKV